MVNIRTGQVVVRVTSQDLLDLGEIRESNWDEERCQAFISLYSGIIEDKLREQVQNVLCDLMDVFDDEWTTT